MMSRRTINEKLVIVIAVLISFASLVSCSPTSFSYARSTTAHTCNSSSSERVFGVTTSSSTALFARGGSVQEVSYCRCFRKYYYLGISPQVRIVMTS
jgi:hypothetical protein